MPKLLPRGHIFTFTGLGISEFVVGSLSPSLPSPCLSCLCVCVCMCANVYVCVCLWCGVVCFLYFWKWFDNLACQVFFAQVNPSNCCERDCWYWPVLPYFPHNVVKILLLAILLVSLYQEKQILFLFSLKNIFTTF